MVPFCPFHFIVLLLKPESRKNGTLIINGLLRNLVNRVFWCSKVLSSQRALRFVGGYRGPTRFSTSPKLRMVYLLKPQQVRLSAILAWLCTVFWASVFIISRFEGFRVRVVRTQGLKRLSINNP